MVKELHALTADILHVALLGSELYIYVCVTSKFCSNQGVNILKIGYWGGTCNMMEDMISVQSNVVRKAERKRSLGRPTFSCDGNIKIDLQELIKDMDWI